jgi:hypothetical protein
MKKIALEELLGRGGPGEILVLGEADSFTRSEIVRALEKRGFAVTEEYRPGAALAVIESRRLTPPLESVSEAAYEAGVPHYPMEELERILSRDLKAQSVLMSLKLSKDRARLIRLLRNEHIDDDFFLKLLGLYVWESGELMGSDEDRYVLIAVLERFLDLSVYERDALYSPVTLLRLINSTDRAALLDALLGLPDFEFRLQRRRIGIAEAVAAREILEPETVAKLLRRREPRIDRVLGANPALDTAGRDTLFERGEEETLKALAAHPDLEDELFEALLERGGEVTEELLRRQRIDGKRLERILSRDFDPATLAILGENERLEPAIYPELIALEIPELLANIAANDATPPEVLERLAEREELHPRLALNPAASEAILRRLWEGGDREVLEALSYNPATPTEILRALYETGEFPSHQGLAANPATPTEILHQLKTDHRLWLILQRNEKFVTEANREMGMR